MKEWDIQGYTSQCFMETMGPLGLKYCCNWVIQPFAYNGVGENKRVPFALKSSEGLPCEP